MRVLGAALNPLDIGIAASIVSAVRHEKPYVPGIECTGVVVESERFLPGEIVYAVASQGADYITGAILPVDGGPPSDAGAHALGTGRQDGGRDAADGHESALARVLLD
jgi:NADPH:quinone reductase-like Zn-dependent oxidoreductase